jgi:hypothetical protein
VDIGYTPTSPACSKHESLAKSMKHFWKLWVATPTRLKVLNLVLACGFAAALAYAIGDLEFHGERPVMDYVGSLLAVILIVGAPMLVMGLIMHVMHWAKGSGRPNADPPIQPFDQSKGG